MHVNGRDILTPHTWAETEETTTPKRVYNLMSATWIADYSIQIPLRCGGRNLYGFVASHRFDYQMHYGSHLEKNQDAAVRESQNVVTKYFVKYIQDIGLKNVAF